MWPRCPSRCRCICARSALWSSITPVDRPATPADADAFREKVVEVQTAAEVPVVAKETIVVEEIVVHKEVAKRVHTVRDTVRHTAVEVEADPATPPPAGATHPCPLAPSRPAPHRVGRPSQDA